MTTRLSIGDFSRMTYLSVKALRRYHDLGPLVPATVDGFTGYRYTADARPVSGQARGSAGSPLGSGLRAGVLRWSGAGVLLTCGDAVLVSAGRNYVVGR
jgi:hypothetical protein